MPTLSSFLPIVIVIGSIIIITLILFGEIPYYFRLYLTRFLKFIFSKLEKRFPQTLKLRRSIAKLFIIYGKRSSNFLTTGHYIDCAIMLAPDKIFYLEKGLYFYELGLNDAAIECFTESIKIDTKNPWAYTIRGIVYFHNNCFEQSKSDFRTAYPTYEKAKATFEKYFPGESIEIGKVTVKTESYQHDEILIPDSQQIITVSPDKILLEKYGIKHLFHMTDIQNVVNIFENGLLSHNSAHSKKLVMKDISDQDVNARRVHNEPLKNRSIHEYAPLYFTVKNPMLYRRKSEQNNIAILVWDAELMYSEDWIFTDGNAASKSTKFYDNLEDLGKLSWECINDLRWNNHADGKRLRCAEVLVFPKVNIKYLKEIYCNNAHAKKYLKDKLAVNTPIPIEINRELFFNDIHV